MPLPSPSVLQVVCAPGRTKNLDAFEEADGRTVLLLWKTPKGGLRSDHVLREDGDCMYLYDEQRTYRSGGIFGGDGGQVPVVIEMIVFEGGEGLEVLHHLG